MKRVAFALFGTVASLVALLSFKSQGHAVVGAQGLPSASLPSAAATSPAAPAATSTPAPASSAAGSTSAAPSSAAATTTAPKASASKNYDGQAVETRYGTVQVQVTVAGTKITNAQFLQLTSFDPRSADINSQAGPLLLQETLQAQSSQIDTISGATYTSEGYLQSLQSALDQAGIK